MVTGDHSMRLPHERGVEETVLFDGVSMIDVILVCVVMMGSLTGSVVGSAVLVEVASRGDVVGDEWQKLHPRQFVKVHFNISAAV